MTANSIGKMAWHRERIGHGTSPLILLHGWSMNLRVFDALAAILADEFTSCSFDLPGHGRSSFAGYADRPLTIDELARDLLAQLPAEPVTLLGWSQGGQLALQVAALAPARVRRLLLVATTPCFIAQADWPQGMPAHYASAFAAQLDQEPQVLLRDFLQLQLRGSPPSLPAQAHLLAALVAHGLADPQALGTLLQTLFSTDLRGALPGIHTPALVISGQNDSVTSAAAGRALAKRLGNARYREFSGTAHLPFITHGVEFADALREFVATS